MLDLLIRGARVVDGTGAPSRIADVGVRDGRIVFPDRHDSARETVDAGGLALMPGIVDVHTHYDAQITWDPTLSPSVSLGVTTAVLGNCGFGIAPCPAPLRETMVKKSLGGRGHGLERAAARYALGLRDLRRVSGSARARAALRECRGARRSFHHPHRGDGRRGFDARR